MPQDFIPLSRPPETVQQPALWFTFQGTKIAVLNHADKPGLPACMQLDEHGLIAQRSLYLGLYRGQHCYAAEISESQALPDGWQLLGLRDLFGIVEETLAVVSGRAYQIVDWDRDHQYCSRCATPTRPRESERPPADRRNRNSTRIELPEKQRQNRLGILAGLPQIATWNQEEGDLARGHVCQRSIRQNAKAAHRDNRIAGESDCNHVALRRAPEFRQDVRGLPVGEPIEHQHMNVTRCHTHLGRVAAA